MQRTKNEFCAFITCFSPLDFVYYSIGCSLSERRLLNQLMKHNYESVELSFLGCKIKSDKLGNRSTVIIVLVVVLFFAWVFLG